MYLQAYLYICKYSIYIIFMIHTELKASLKARNKYNIFVLF